MSTSKGKVAIVTGGNSGIGAAIALALAEQGASIVIDYVVDVDGNTETRDVYAALVHNYSKMSYEVIGKWLDENSAIPAEVSRVENLEEQVRLQFEASKRLRSARKKLGALRLETIQANPVMDEHGEVSNLELVEPNSARDIIESFMVAANGTMAEFLDRKGIASIRRVVTTPVNWPRIVEIAEELNESLPSEPDVRARPRQLSSSPRSQPRRAAFPPVAPRAPSAGFAPRDRRPSSASPHSTARLRSRRRRSQRAARLRQPTLPWSAPAVLIRVATATVSDRALRSSVSAMPQQALRVVVRSQSARTV